MRLNQLHSRLMLGFRHNATVPGELLAAIARDYLNLDNWADLHWGASSCCGVQTSLTGLPRSLLRLILKPHGLPQRAAITLKSAAWGLCANGTKLSASTFLLR